MKTKNKLLALLEIAIVLSSVFLVALPATANAAEEDDYVLGIYGNANEDDTIDMRDMTYVKLIFFGKKPETELADAKYDGKINPLDFIQIKLIIVGKEKELTVVDTDEDAVTIHKPVNRIIPMATKVCEALKIFNEGDKVVGVTSPVVKDEVFFPKLSKLPVVDSKDYEAIIALNPDIVLAYSPLGTKWSDLKEKLPDNIPVFTFCLVNPEIMEEEIKKLGYILGKTDRVEEYVDFYQHDLNTIEEKTGGLSDAEKPRVYIESMHPYSVFTKKGLGHLQCIMAGGINIAADLPGSSYTVDPEWVMMQNPDIIVKISWWAKKESGYEVDDPSGITAIREEIMNRPELAKVAAVKNGRVYVIAAEIWGTPHYFVCVGYQAKLFHPNLFEDLDPEAIHQKYLTRFQQLDYDLDEHGVFVYPPIEIDGGLAGIPDRYKGEI